MKVWRFLSLGLAVLSLSFAGCRGDVSTTDDSTAVELEVPKVEMGDDEVDVNPKTDEDVDIDTPLEGDS